MKVNIIIEKGKTEFWGRVEGYDFLPVTVGNTIREVLERVKIGFTVKSRIGC